MGSFTKYSLASSITVKGCFIPFRPYLIVLLIENKSGKYLSTAFAHQRGIYSFILRFFIFELFADSWKFGVVEKGPCSNRIAVQWIEGLLL